MRKLAIIGTVGLPARYGGFETLAENLVKYSAEHSESKIDITVYCSGQVYDERQEFFLGARLRYSRLSANGMQSVLYDALTALDAAARGHDRILLLGVSGAFVIPIIKIFYNSKIFVNIDGIEWKRQKWGRLARFFLRWSESIAIRESHGVIADNQAIADYVMDGFGVRSFVISYGGDHALLGGDIENSLTNVPERFALSLCRIEPENNIEMILEAFSVLDTPLVFVGNWNNSKFGRQLRNKFREFENIFMIDPIYDSSQLKKIRERADLYIHGHSAGGTNPSLVEMMHFKIPIVAYNCAFNRFTTEDCAEYFLNSDELIDVVRNLSSLKASKIAIAMQNLARSRYTWDAVGKAYFSLLGVSDAH